MKRARLRLITRNRYGELCGACIKVPTKYSVWFSDGVLRPITANKIEVFEHLYWLKCYMGRRGTPFPTSILFPVAFPHLKYPKDARER